MCDVKKYSDIFNELKELKPEDTMQLMIEAKNDDEKEFFGMLGNFLLQKKQKEIIEGKLF